jgi:Sialic acid synthase
LIAKTKKPIILSTGMASYKDIDLAIKTISKFHKKIILLYCVSGYPTPMEELNLISMLDLKKRYSLTIGLSDHSRGTLAPIIATSLGAALIEKHFTIDKNDNGPDSFFSITKEELKDLCISTNKTWLAVGSKKDKKVKKIEKENYKFRRSLYVIKNIKKGDFFTKDNIKSVRPGDHIHPKFFDKIMAKKQKKI